MTFCMVTDVMSPHEMPLAAQLANKLGSENFHYIVAGATGDEQNKLGWSVDTFPWCLDTGQSVSVREAANILIRRADVVLFGNRDHPLIPWRVTRNMLTFYGSERWFKPPIGVLRLAHIRFIKRMIKLWRYFRRKCFYYLPQGVYAAKDMKCIAFCPDNIRLFGYLVEPSAPVLSPKHRKGALHVLWAGRMLGWKRVDTLIKAVGVLLREGRNIRLTLVGQGPDEQKLKNLVAGIQASVRMNSPGNGLPITFHPPVPISQVRDFMRQSDVYVLPSSGYEGWGVVVNEAMLEGCAVVASREAGAAATLIRHGESGLLFPSGDVGALVQILRELESDERLRLKLATAGQEMMLNAWTPKVAAERLIAFSEAILDGREPQQWARGPLMKV